METLFSVYRWFGRAMEDGSTKRFFEHLDGQNDFEEERTYELMIMTAKDSFAGTDEGQGYTVSGGLINPRTTNQDRSEDWTVNPW